MNTKVLFVVIITITLGTTAITITPLSADAKVAEHLDAPPAITGENVYVTWWTNKTGI